MSDIQLYLAIGLPVILNLLALFWRSRAAEKTLGARIDGVNTRIDSVHARIDSIEQVMNAKFEAVYARFDAVDVRLEAANQSLLRVEG